MRKINAGMEPPEPLTREEARELIEHHALKASEAARTPAMDAAVAHAAAAEALGVWMRYVGFVVKPDDLRAQHEFDFDFDGGGEGY